MPPRIPRAVTLILLTMLGSSALSAQKPDRSATRPLAASVGEVLQDLSARADIVFVGQVVAIERSAPQAGVGVIDVTFQVLQPILGVTGSSYTMREWGGLWTGGRQRLHLGQRAMFFLHAPGASGLSSPVDGLEGAVPLIPMGTDQEPLLDVRWLQARVQRPVGSPLVDPGYGAVTVSDAMTAVAGWRKGVAFEPAKRSLPLGIQPEAQR